MEIRLPPAVCVSLVSAITTACGGGAAAIDTTPDAPAATGSVRVERRPDGLALAVFVQQLAPPEDLKQGAAAYVVWAKPARGGPARNVGALALDADEGVLRTAIAAEDTSLIVTAEPTAQASSPSGEPVLWAYVDVPEPPAKPDTSTEATSARADAPSATRETPPAPPAPACKP